MAVVRAVSDKYRGCAPKLIAALGQLKPQREQDLVLMPAQSLSIWHD
jgi:hypothetical protein